MSELFKRDKSVISRHIKNAFEEELKDEQVVAKFVTTSKHGAMEGKTQTHMVDYSLLDDYDHRTLRKIDERKIKYKDCIEIINKLRFNEESTLMNNDIILMNFS